MTVRGSSPATKDTLRLAQAAQPTIAAFGILHAAGRIPAAALVDLRYRFAAWVMPVQEMGNHHPPGFEHAVAEVDTNLRPSSAHKRIVPVEDWRREPA